MSAPATASSRMPPVGTLLLACALAAAGVAVCALVAPAAGWGIALLALAGLGLLARPVPGPHTLSGWSRTAVEAGLGLAVIVALGGLLRGVLLALGWHGVLAPLAVAGLCAVGAAVRPGTVRRVLRLVAIEITKLLRTRLFVLSASACVVVTLLSASLHEPLEGESGWTLAATALGTGLWAAEVFLLVLGATSIAGEQAQGTLKMIVPHAYRRSEWIVAKAVVLALAASVLGGLVMLTSTLYTSATVGLGDVVKTLPPGFGEAEGTVEVFQTARTMQGHLTTSFLAGLAGIATSAWIGLLFSSVLEGLVAALSATFLMFLGLKSADVLLGISRDVMEHVYSTPPELLRTWTGKLGQGLNETWNEAAYTHGLALACVTSLLALLIAISVFGRRDLHG